MAAFVSLAVCFGFALAILGFTGLAGMAIASVMTTLGGRFVK